MDLLTIGDINTFIIGIVCVLLISLFCAVLYERGTEFSMNIFLASFAIGMGVLIWIGIFPVIGFGISALCILGIIYAGGSSE